MDRIETKTFSTSEEEVDFWKTQAQHYNDKWKEVQEEFDEFREDSRQLEKELEEELSQEKSRVQQLTIANEKARRDCDQAKERLEHVQQEAHTQVSELQTALNETRIAKEELQKYIRELEQSNDDLERAKRATVVSLEDFEQRLNLTIERNAFLENELDEKESLRVSVQRLKDETRDLKQELDLKGNQVLKDPTRTERLKERSDSLRSERSKVEEVARKRGSSVGSGVGSTGPIGSPPSEAMQVDETNTETNTLTFPTQSSAAPHNTTGGLPDSVPSTPTGSSSFRTFHSPHSNTGTPLTPSARISALNIVGDLLRKVGALESKLASCRNFVKEPHGVPGGVSGGPLGSPTAAPGHSPGTKLSPTDSPSTAVQRPNYIAVGPSE